MFFGERDMALVYLMVPDGVDWTESGRWVDNTQCHKLCTINLMLIAHVAACIQAHFATIAGAVECAH